MPGPVSDSYDPEFSTAAKAQDVADAIRKVRDVISCALGEELKNIVEVVQGESGYDHTVQFSDRDLRVIRFCLDRSVESI